MFGRSLLDWVRRMQLRIFVVDPLEEVHLAGRVLDQDNLRHGGDPLRFLGPSLAVDMHARRVEI